MTIRTPEEVQQLKQAPAVGGVPEIILKRWSPRAFAEKAVSAADLRAIFTGANCAASSYNEQPLRYVVGQRTTEEGNAVEGSTYSLVLGTLGEFNQTWVKSAPVLILSVARTTFEKNGQPNRHALHDTGAATAYLALTAAALGLQSHSMAGYDPEKARTAFSIPEGFEPAAVTALGYPGDPEILEGELHEREVTPRERKPLMALVFSGAWEKSAGL